MVAGQTVCLRRLARGEHDQEVRFGRLLRNDAVSLEALIAGWSDRLAEAAAGRHVLGLQDTTEIYIPTTSQRTRGLGKIKKGNCRGVLLHPMMVVDAETGEALGLATGRVWTRRDEPLSPHAGRTLDEKESGRWLVTVVDAEAALATAAMVTAVCDREGDVYAVWARLPEGVQLIARVMRDHRLAEHTSLVQKAAAAPVADHRTIEIVERAGRPARPAKLALRFGTAAIARPRKKAAAGLPPSVALSFVSVTEVDPPKGQEPLSWLLLTTHPLTDAASAWRIVDWYKRRWLIEQLFRVLKTKGFRIEDSQLHTAERIEKLVAIAAKAAVIVLQLTQVRDGPDEAPASNAFNPAETAALAALERRLLERTPTRANPHAPQSLAWATWIIARLGGWNGYPSSRKPGPITFYNGLDYFRACADGWALRDVYMP